jgi:probable HAF family extracellular repeat protein
MNAKTYRPIPVRIAGVLLAIIPCWSAAEDLYRLTEVGTLNGGERSLAVAMNSSGQIAGSSLFVPGVALWHAFLWDGTAIRDLGTLGGTQSFATAINSAGQITGYSWTLDNAEKHAFLWNGSAMVDLGTLGGTQSEGKDINASARVTGTSSLAGTSNSHAFVWDGAKMKDLGTLGGATSTGNEINSKGQVAGTARLANGQNRAFFWDGTKMQNLGTLGGTRSNGQAINDLGHIAGTSTTSGTNRLSLFLWDGSSLRNLGNLGQNAMSVNDMNGSDQIVGLSRDPFVPGVGPQDYSFMWDGTVLQNLGAGDSCYAPESIALAVNSAGHVVGNSCNGAFLWKGNQLWFIEDLIDPQDPLKAYISFPFADMGAPDINARGQIAANAYDSRYDQIRAFLLTPLEYQIVILGPAANSKWKLGATVSIKIALVNASGQRISDARAATLTETPCKVNFSATGAQNKATTCMKYDATANVFFFNWKLAATGIGSTTLKVSATYKFSMPDTITTTKSRSISIVQ